MTLENILASIDSEIAQLKQARALLSGDGAKKAETPAAQKKRKMSAAARKRIGDAQASVGRSRELLANSSGTLLICGLPTHARLYARKSKLQLADNRENIWRTIRESRSRTRNE